MSRWSHLGSPPPPPVPCSGCSSTRTCTGSLTMVQQPKTRLVTAAWSWSRSRWDGARSKSALIAVLSCAPAGSSADSQFSQWVLWAAAHLDGWEWDAEARALFDPGILLLMPQRLQNRSSMPLGPAGRSPSLLISPARSLVGLAFSLAASLVGWAFFDATPLAGCCVDC